VVNWNSKNNGVREGWAMTNGAPTHSHSGGPNGSPSLHAEGCSAIEDSLALIMVRVWPEIYSLKHGQRARYCIDTCS